MEPVFLDGDGSGAGKAAQSLSGRPGRYICVAERRETAFAYLHGELRTALGKAMAELAVVDRRANSEWIPSGTP